ncbi:MAG: Aspartyl/glutamyl-tRNA(Asn/Gln) amidotransferase subunit B [Parcubacteria group bacterium GW2011_GWB1_56_8]|nr:MAG: Aspartyl/glutamyl-tRNA(Asn/Gln) amidotransferase subunit B [Parcubacteria group bacterium GW2011_GWB1_56_8]
MKDYQPTIGLEVHATLNTQTKMFCDCLNDPDEEHPNQNVCPVCLGHPGALPVINKQAVEAVLRVGLALKGSVNPVSKFDRKNYFYPDLPKGYQISQYDQPLILGGELFGVRIRRIHLEEDAGRLLHEIPGEAKKGEASYVDFNRAGTPLMELVTEPDIRSAEQAVAFAKEFQLILQYLGASDADMEKGLMRVEANVSLDMGPKVELKNINSFKAVGSAIAYEIERQKGSLEKGVKVEHETRGWDDAKQKTVSQRTKEEAHDYRYFPEPDLPPLEPAKVFDVEDLRAHVPELPAQKRARFEREFKLSAEQAAQLIQDKQLADFFEAAESELAAHLRTYSAEATLAAKAGQDFGGQARDERETVTIEKTPQNLLFNYLTSDLIGLMNEAGTRFSAEGGSASGGDVLKIEPEELAHLIDLIADGTIMSRQAKDILRKMFQTGEDPETIMRAEGLRTVSDAGEVEQVVRATIVENPNAVADYKKGKEASLQFLIGKAMRKFKGRGNPATIQEILTKLLR